MVGSEQVSLAVTAANFDTKNVGTSKTVTAAGLSLTGTAASNYSLASGATAQATANITTVQLTPAIAANNKSYDGTTAATLSSQTVTGMVGSEQVGLAVTATNFDTKNAGTGITVTATGLSLTGPAASNYSLATGATAQATANITAKALTPLFTANNKVYDGTTTAIIATRSLSGVVGADDVILTNGTAVFADANAGVDKTVTASGFALGGTATGNYSLTSTTATTKATITPQVGMPVADTYYVGSNFYWTTSSTSSNTTLNLVASLKNDPNYNAGDITTAKVSFRIVNSDGSFTPINGAQNLPVGLVNSGDKTMGTASVSVPYSITGTNTTSLRVAVILSGNYRSVATSVTSALITIAAPTPGGLIAGGGKFLTAGVTAPQPAGYVKGTGAQFSYFVKYSKSGQNPQGSVEVLVSSPNDYTTGLPDVNGKPHFYLLKSNSISTLAIDNTNASAQFTAKANISEVNSDGTVVLNSIEGNCTMQLDMIDKYRNPTQKSCTVDQLAITVYRSKGGVWYSSAWDGSKPVLSTISSTDDITVTGNAGTCGTTTTNVTKAVADAPTTSVAKAVAATDADPTSAPTSNLLEIFPNPLHAAGTVHFHTMAGGKAQVYVYNAMGMLVSTLYNAEIASGQEYSLTLSTENLADGVYSCRLIVNGKVENKRFTVQH